MYEPISIDELFDVISKTVNELDITLLKFWNLIKINPEKWEEKDFGKDSNGFWVVAICGKQIVWYNDIEDGFNISSFRQYGKIPEYSCDQYELNHAVHQLYYMNSEDRIIRGKPEPLN